MRKKEIHREITPQFHLQLYKQDSSSLKMLPFPRSRPHHSLFLSFSTYHASITDKSSCECGCDFSNVTLHNFHQIWISSVQEPWFATDFRNDTDTQIKHGRHWHKQTFRRNYYTSVHVPLNGMLLTLIHLCLCHTEWNHNLQNSLKLRWLVPLLQIFMLLTKQLCLFSLLKLWWNVYLHKRI